MHIETLKIFCDLANLQSFSKTAEKHFISQSAISQQLAQLETSHKCQLVNRKKRPIELTKAGQLLYSATQDMLDRYEHFKNELNTLRTSVGSRINVGAIFSIGMHTLPNYVKKFMVGHPNVNVHIEYFSAATIYELVLAGEIDIGLVAVPKKDKRLDVHDFEDEPLVLACNPKHTLAREPYVDIHAGISILPQIAILQELAAGTIKAVPFSNEKFIRPTGIIVRKGKILGQAARYFIELLQKGAR